MASRRMLSSSAATPGTLAGFADHVKCPRSLAITSPAKGGRGYSYKSDGEPCRRRSERTEALRGCPSVVAPDNEQVRSRTSCRQPIVGWLWLAHSSHRASISAAFVRYADLPASLAGAKPILQASST